MNGEGCGAPSGNGQGVMNVSCCCCCGGEIPRFAWVTHPRPAKKTPVIPNQVRPTLQHPGAGHLRSGCATLHGRDKVGKDVGVKHDDDAYDGGEGDGVPEDVAED